MPILEKIRQLLNRELIRHAAIMAFSQGIRLGIQAAYFIIIARTLGVEGYGLFVGLLALAGTVTPFATWGSEHLLVKAVARDRTCFRERLGTALALSTISGLVLTLICFGISQATLSESTSILVIASVLITELVSKSIHTQAYISFLAVNEIKICAFLGNVTSFKNLVAAVVLLVLPAQNNPLEIWSILYSISTLMAAGLSLWLVMGRIDKPAFAIASLKHYEYREGLYFSINQSASSINANLDKAMLSSLSALEGAGIYAAAYRLVEISSVPIRALMTVSYAKFFQHGAEGIQSGVRFARQVLKLSASYALLMTLVLPLAAPVVPLILGDEYRNAVDAMRWLAPMVLLLGLRFPAADLLSGIGQQGLRSVIQVAVALVNFVANLAWIPTYSWKGAAWATLLSDGIQTIALWCIVWYLLQERRRKVQDVQEP